MNLPPLPHLVCEHAQVVWELVVGGDDDALPACVKLRPPGATKDLLYIQHAQLTKRTLLGIIHLQGGE